MWLPIKSTRPGARAHSSGSLANLSRKHAATASTRGLRFLRPVSVDSSKASSIASTFRGGISDCIRCEGPQQQPGPFRRQRTRAGHGRGAHFFHRAARQHSLRRNSAVETQLRPIFSAVATRGPEPPAAPDSASSTRSRPGPAESPGYRRRNAESPAAPRPAKIANSFASRGLISLRHSRGENSMARCAP